MKEATKIFGWFVLMVLAAMVGQALYWVIWFEIMLDAH